MCVGVCVRACVRVCMHIHVSAFDIYLSVSLHNRTTWACEIMYVWRTNTSAVWDLDIYMYIYIYIYVYV